MIYFHIIHITAKFILLKIYTMWANGKQKHGYGDAFIFLKNSTF